MWVKANSPQTHQTIEGLACCGRQFPTHSSNELFAFARELRRIRMRIFALAEHRSSNDQAAGTEAQPESDGSAAGAARLVRRLAARHLGIRLAGVTVSHPPALRCVGVASRLAPKPTKKPIRRVSHDGYGGTEKAKSAAQSGDRACGPGRLQREFHGLAGNHRLHHGAAGRRSPGPRRLGDPKSVAAAVAKERRA